MRISDWSSDVCSSDLHAVFNRIARRVRMTPLPQADGLIEEAPGIGNHLRAARGIIAAPLFRAVPLGNDIGAIERVIKAAQAAVPGVQRIAGVGEGQDALGPGESAVFRGVGRGWWGEGGGRKGEIRWCPESLKK